MIGVFDSGLGGLTVLKALRQIFPQYAMLYFGDTARLPYGTKDVQSIRKWSFQNVQWLKNQGAKIVVVACHTASTTAGHLLKKDFTIPVFDMTTPLLEIINEEGDDSRIGLIGTPATIQSGFYQKELSRLPSKIFFQSCPLFVPLVEENWMHRPGTKEVVRESLAPLRKQKIKALVLACTHYPLLKDVIQEVLPGVKIINPAQRLAKNIETFLSHHQDLKKSLKKGKTQFFFSAEPYHLNSISHSFLGKGIQANIVSIDD